MLACKPSPPAEVAPRVAVCAAVVERGEGELAKATAKAVVDVFPEARHPSEMGCENEVEENEPTGRARVGVPAVPGFDPGVWGRAGPSAVLVVAFTPRWLFLLYGRLTC